jgi:hypothetical protein
MASLPLPRHLPFRQRLPKHFSGHRRFGGPFPMTFPITAVSAVASQRFPQSLPKWQCLSKPFPGPCRSGSGFRSIFPGYDLNRQKNGGRRMERFGFSYPHSPAFQRPFRLDLGHLRCFPFLASFAGFWKLSFGTRQNDRPFPYFT